ncbi:MAG: hypothetical protein M0Z34_11170 [Nitrospiraceae bacterium]|nr:hypothetical protein [Nitrospiraceae bacterium]
MEIASRIRGQEQAAIQHTVISAASHSSEVTVGNPQLSARQAITAVASQPYDGQLQAGIAVAVLNKLLWDYAKTSGREVSLSQASTFADHEYKLFEDSQASPTPLPAPPGESPQQAFTSAQAISAYQKMLTTDNMLAAVAGPRTNSVGTERNRTPALRTWMAGELSQHVVAIHGVPGLTATNLPDFLPDGL